jgi:hypothetical protein
MHKLYVEKNLVIIIMTDTRKKNNGSAVKRRTQTKKRKKLNYHDGFSITKPLKDGTEKEAKYAVGDRCGLIRISKKKNIPYYERKTTRAPPVETHAENLRDYVIEESDNGCLKSKYKFKKKGGDPRILTIQTIFQSVRASLYRVKNTVNTEEESEHAEYMQEISTKTDKILDLINTLNSTILDPLTQVGGDNVIEDPRIHNLELECENVVNIAAFKRKFGEGVVEFKDGDTEIETSALIRKILDFENSEAYITWIEEMLQYKKEGTIN